MDANDLRIIFTLVAFIVFLGILWWAFSGQRKQAFDEAAMLPFSDDEPEAGTLAVKTKVSGTRQQ